MNGYTPVFDRAEKAFNAAESPDVLFDSFRTQHEVYGFIDNGDRPPDEEAIAIARRINQVLYDAYLEANQGRKLIGYGNTIPVFGKYSNLDSRHVMMSVHLLSTIPEHPKVVVEIGGGFGNWLRLNTGLMHFSKWTIVDLPHVGKLQKWVLDKEVVDPAKYELVEAGYRSTWGPIDLVLGTHSMSEFSIETFIDYFYSIVVKSQYFYYAYHNTRPTPELIKAKRDIIENHFCLVNSMVSEGGNVTNCLYRRKAA